MREPPSGIGDPDVLAAVRAGWSVDLTAVEHLPVGFGAHHWVGVQGGRPVLFITLDQLGSRHSAASLETTYAAAAALAAAGLEFVLASVPTPAGRFTVPFRGGALSATPWRAGRAVGDSSTIDPSLARGNVAMLARLHAATPPPGLRAWHPLVGPGLADELAARLSAPWTAGPYGERARTALTAHLTAIRRWTAHYLALAALARRRPWVVTHGEPHPANQLRTADGIVLVDWESLTVAPRERDLGPLVGSGHAALVDPDPAMLELFDLEWRLDEIAQYAEWFAAPHTGTASDAVAYGGLVAELDRPDWTVPRTR